MTSRGSVIINFTPLPPPKQPQTTPKVPLKSTKKPSKTIKGTLRITTALHSFGIFLKRMITSLFCKRQPQGGSMTAKKDEDSVSIFQPFKNEFLHENLFDKIKGSFKKSTGALGIDDECLSGIADGEILPEHVVDEFQSLDSQKKDLIFLWSTYVKRYDLLVPLVKIGANIHATIPNLGYNALHLSAYNGCVKTCEWLISQGLDLNLTVDEISPLHCAVIRNFPDCTNLLLTRGATLDKTVLDCAFEDNLTDSLQHLLNEFVKIKTVSGNGPTTPKTAADHGMECVRILISYFQKIDLKKTTTLHLAAANNLFECCQFLIDGGADPNAKDHKGRTALHLAAKARSSKCLKILLKAGCNVNAPANSGSTPLHMTFTAFSPHSPALEALNVLLKAKADVNASNKFGCTPLHLAADNSGGIKDPSVCVDRLIMSGANVTVRTNGGFSTLSLVCQKTPGCINTICRRLDSSIFVSGLDSFDKQKVCLTFDFAYLLDKSTKERMWFLKTLEKEGQKKLIEHPLCRAFLHLHWREIRKFYFLRIFLWFVLVILLTVYVIFGLTHECYNAAVLAERCDLCMDNIVSGVSSKNILTETCKLCLDTFNSLNNISESASTEILEVRSNDLTVVKNVTETILNEAKKMCLSESVFGTFLIKQPNFIPSIKLVLIFVAFIESIRKILIILCQRFKKRVFFQIENLSEWFVILSVFLLSYPWNERTPDWQKTIGGIAVLLAWADFMIMIGQLPIFDTYVAMFTRVLSKFFKLLLVFSCLLIGFTASLCVFFPSETSFQNPLIGFIKTLSMMTGGADFDIVKDNPQSNTPSFLNFSAYIFFTLFLIFATVVLMPLLTGIAVDDIQGLHKTACLSKLIRQMELIYFLEMVIIRSYLPQKIHKYLLTLLWQRLHVETCFSPFDPLDGGLPREVMMAAVHLAEQKAKWAKSTRCWLDTGKYSDSTSEDEENSREELQQLKDTVSKLMENNSSNLSEERFIKHENDLHEKLEQLENANRSQNEMICKLMSSSLNTLTGFIKREENLHEELRQLKEVIRAQNGIGFQSTV